MSEGATWFVQNRRFRLFICKKETSKLDQKQASYGLLQLKVVFLTFFRSDKKLYNILRPPCGLHDTNLDCANERNNRPTKTLWLIWCKICNMKDIETKGCGGPI